MKKKIGKRRSVKVLLCRDEFKDKSKKCILKSKKQTKRKPFHRRDAVLVTDRVRKSEMSLEQSCADLIKTVNHHKTIRQYFIKPKHFVPIKYTKNVRWDACVFLD